jgi:hypothetical protein
MVAFLEASLVCIKLETVRTPRVVAIRPERAALNAVLVRVSISRFVQVIILGIIISSLGLL